MRLALKGRVATKLFFVTLAVFSPLTDNIAKAEPTKQIICVFNQLRIFDRQNSETETGSNSYKKGDEDRRPKSDRKSEDPEEDGGDLTSCQEGNLKEMRR